MPDSSVRALSFQCRDARVAVIDDQRVRDRRDIVDDRPAFGIEFRQRVEAGAWLVRLAEGIEHIDIMAKRAAQARRARQFAFRVEHQHRARIEIEVGLKHGRGLAGARARDRDHAAGRRDGREIGPRICRE